MSMNTKKNISIVLLVLALLLWLLRKMNVLYIPGLSMVLLGFSRFPLPVTEKICKISIKRLDKR